MVLSLGGIAARFGCELVGDPDAEVSCVSTLENARPGAMTFLANPIYRPQLAQTTATAVAVRPNDVEHCPSNALVVDEPYLLFARVATELFPPKQATPGIHPSAVVEPSASVSTDAEVAAHAYVGVGSSVAAGVQIGPGAVVGENCVVGVGSQLGPNASLIKDVTLGARCIVHAGAVLGADGFGHAASASGWVKVPQIGRLLVGDDVEIGANTSIDRGAIDDTVIEDGVRLDNQIQIAHNCRIGAHTVIAAQVGISGSTRIGQRCMIAGQVGIVGHIRICDNVVITGAAVVTKSIEEPGVYSASFPAERDGNWKRNVARFRRLDKLTDRLRQVEERVQGIDTKSK